MVRGGWCAVRRGSLLGAAALSLLVATPPATAQDTLRVPGLRDPVEIIRDRWGINHIYARNEHDLFFAQGYAAARDRLFQLEVWRRQATGTVAELLGPRELERDIGTRLFKFRGDLRRELAHYHPRGGRIIAAFVAGINAYVAETERNPALVPLELRLLGTKPGRWTPEVVISRHQGLVSNVEDELTYGRAVALLGPEKVKEIERFHPHEPRLELDSAINGTLLSQPILRLYQASRSPVSFQPSDLAVAHRGDTAAYSRLVGTAGELRAAYTAYAARRERRDVGSNNWVVSGRHTQSGYPIMANDPHRALSAPSLRYWVHLVAPGWDVIGGGEPVLPGVSIGHNPHGAWGLTIFETDSEDLYVYRTDPLDASRYWYRGRWVPMRILRDTIPVRGQAPVTVALKFTRHGPVVYEDTVRRVAYAVRAAWTEVGGAPYLASLRMNQARTWAEFRDACRYSNIPGENMVWADRRGNIGWQAVGIAPVRPTWSGLVPVPGDGRYEWAGYLPMLAKPHAYNPPEGFIATANNNLTRPDYPHLDAIGYVWADPYRYDRIVEVLSSGRRLSMADMMRLQTDYLSIPARRLVPLLAGLRAADDRVDEARRMLLSWDFVLEKQSVPAGIYAMWQRRVSSNVAALAVPEAARPLLGGVSMKRTIDWLTAAPPRLFGTNPTAARDALLLRSLDEAVAALTQRFGPDMSAWQYGQPKYKHVLIAHPMSGAVPDSLRRRLEVGPAPRGGDSYTPGMTGGSDNQRSGASFRIIADVGDWEAAVGTNTPGQSGNPDSPHYRDLFALWSADQYFPVSYSRSRVESVAASRTVLVPNAR
ncbi:MAG: penicillin acylase family protein [Gemmatimonadaceae bacterium]